MLCESRVRRLSLLAVLSVVFGLSPVVQAQRPGSSDALIGQAAVSGVAAGAERPWIGVACTPVPELLRANIDVPEGQGLLVRQVVPGSPAEKAGLAPYDVLLKANGKPVESLATLVRAVADAGEDGLALTWLHQGKPRTSVLKPVPRPGPTGRAGDESLPRDVLRWRFGRNFTTPFQMRLFGTPLEVPGSDIPEDLNIKIEKQGSKPARILVQKGDRKWDITEDQLDKLPKDVRPFVERFTGRHLMAGFSELDESVPLPDIERMPQDPPPEFFSRPETRKLFRKFAPFDIEKRLNQIDRQLEQMRDELRGLRGHDGNDSNRSDAKAGDAKPGDDKPDGPESQDARPEGTRSGSEYLNSRV